jgi:outer membrane lipoprotein SlyB
MQLDNSGMLSGAVNGGVSGLGSGGVYGGILGAIMGALGGSQQNQMAGEIYDQNSSMQKPTVSGADFVQSGLGLRGTDYYMDKGRF